jgi:hypothetical protein
MRMRSVIRSCVIAAVIPAAGCSFGFDSQSSVKSRVILGMSADPPEVIYSLDNPLSAVGTNIQLTALVVDPNDMGAPVPYVWRGCSETLAEFPGANIGDFDTNAQRCLENDATLLAPVNATPAGLPPQGQSPLATLGVAPGVLLSPIAVFTAVTGGGISQIAGAFSGGGPGASAPPTPVWIDAMLRLDNGSSPALYGLKRVVFSPDYPPGKVPNHIPHLTALLFDYKPWEPNTPLPVTIGNCPDDQKVQVAKPGATAGSGASGYVTVCQHTITPVYDPSQDESYTVVRFQQDASGNWETETLKEYLRFQWYIDQGSVDNSATEEATNIVPNPYDPISVHWQEPASPKKTIMNLWVVTSDGRGGESWDTRQVSFAQ